MAAPQEPHVLIIGAGLTGLFIAHGLQRAGISYTLFEAEEAGTYRSREWTMGVHWGVPLIEKLLPPDLMARVIPEASVDKTLDYVTPPTNGSRIYDGVTGEVLKELVSEGKLIRVSRRKLRGLIAERIEVNFGHKLEDITYDDEKDTATAHFANGTSSTGTTIVGADGPRSQIRSLLFGQTEAAAQPLTGIVHLSSTFSYRDAEKAKFVRTAHPVWSMAIHPEVFAYVCIQDVPDPDKPEDWVYFVFICWMGEKDSSLSPEDVMKVAKEKGNKLQEPFKSAIQWIPKDVTFPYVDVSYWVAKSWDSHKGRVTLAGDAAHPMPPYRGQGLNHAVQDAYNFVETMKRTKAGEVTKESSIQEYGEEVAKRGSEETVMSTKNAYMMLAYEDFKESPYMKHGLSKR
ncbi:hypothetical protein PRZ48_014163 [Zasmidium cellare]|uniref:FAD-binding domain-containing protein n=1 Tax=Zasmidium cellare TaxID=395010 RepID=A0ABR0E085_ZASCE|nr:hypothetical protein PRZ48_014163 [Zasmidium cellare]